MKKNIASSNENDLIKKNERIYYAQLGEYLKKLRLSRDYSLEYVGDRVGKTKKTIQNYENGLTYMSTPMLKRLCDIYEISYYEVMNRTAEWL